MKSASKSNIFRDADEMTGKGIRRFRRFNDFNLHTYYSKQAFSPDGKLVAVSSVPASPEFIARRGNQVAGVTHILSFPEGEELFTIEDLPIARHSGNYHQFTKRGNFLVVRLAGNKLGLVNLKDQSVKKVNSRGQWWSFGANSENLLAVSVVEEGLWVACISDEGELLSEYPLARWEDIRKASEISNTVRNLTDVVQGCTNVKISPAGDYCLFRYTIWNKDKSKTLSRELFCAKMDGSSVQRITGGDYTQIEHVTHSFHHHAWVVKSKNKVLYHGLSQNFNKLTFQLYDVDTEEITEVFPAFGAKGHHSLLTSCGRYIVSDCYSGDLDGLIVAIDLETSFITPLATFDLDRKLVDGHPALSPDEQWVLYSCSIDGGSELRAIRFRDFVLEEV